MKTHTKKLTLIITKSAYNYWVITLNSDNNYPPS